MKRFLTGSILAAALCAAPGMSVQAEAGAPVGPDATISAPAFDLPMSSFASPEAAKLLYDIMTTPQPPATADIAVRRAFYDKWNTARMERMLKIWPVKIEKSEMGGVPVQIVVPAAGVKSGNENRVLVNLHGGAFLWGAGNGELVEAIPIAAVMGVKVVTVDYRQGPEHMFPAGSEDVFTVYQALLKDHAAGTIGIYGCSAGGILTAQSTAWIIKQGVPVPGAIGTFCGSGTEYGGDSRMLDMPLNGKPLDPEGGLTMKRLPYFASVKQNGPLVVPGEYPDMLAKFPPTLLLAGSRDFAASGLTVMHRRLAAADVRSDLYLFDGLWHAFFMDPELPESREAYKLIAGFFDRNLAR